MTSATPPLSHETTPHRIVAPVPGQTSPAVRRAAVVASQATAAGTPAHSTVFAPWAALVKAADARYKAQMSTAVAELGRATSDAGAILDQAAAYAAEAAGQLERAAWDAWQRYMALADTTRNEILGRATANYDQAIAWATGQYDVAMADAEKTYKAITADVSRAQADVKTIAS